MNDLHWLDAASLVDAYQRRQLAPSEYVDSLLDHIDRYDDALHVFIDLHPDDIRKEAKRADRALRATRCTPGRLHGVPVGIKDNINVRGVPTTCCSHLMTGNIANRDALIVERLRREGAIILGKVATWEFALGGPSFDLPVPPARNPWRYSHQPGGSSSGCGAGLAAGFFPLAIGTDTGGSVRHPAASCGVVGLKPTYDLVSRDGVFPLAYSLDHVGPMARSVADASLLLDVLAGTPHCPRTGPPAADRLDGWKIGFIKNFHETDMIAAPEVGAALDQAAMAFAVLGATVHDIRVPPLDDFAAVNRVILYSEAWSIHKKQFTSHPDKYGQICRRRIPAGAFLSAEHYVTAQRRRTVLHAKIEAQLAQFDFLLCANSLDPAGPIDQFSSGSPVNSRQARTPFNVTGHPAISLMSGLSSDGLPLSLQLVGRFFNERMLLQAAQAYQRHTGFDTLHPPHL
ncbi:amidase [Bordetella sp. BOR01]|uniref:amidase n=1 Tax=Bordetella sp. BOR01 TaxID=2854779 RepID=UPI001C48FF11|nr:amidase [Bordetella sp. BOR01]MBV7484823.1 amidase [Bordetella sp. BOR01]